MARNASITHKIMSAIPQKDTEPELLLRRRLWRLGMRYRVNVKNLPGKPDIVFTRPKIAVFVDGDYWHGHNWAIRGLSSLEEELSSYSDFWKEKILKNIDRDKKVNTELETAGWVVIRLWESDIRANLDECANMIRNAYHKVITQR